MKKKVLAVQLPASCALECPPCRTPNHGEGNAYNVMQAILNNYENADEVYLTSNGETGRYPDFASLVLMLQNNGKKVSVLCAGHQSIVHGLTRAEISFYSWAQLAAEKAMEKARALNVPFTLSVIASDNTPDLEQLGKKYGAEAVLLRAKQKEGRSSESFGATKLVRISSNNIGVFPVAAYRELEEFADADVICINEHGNIVQYLGDQKAVA